MTTAHSRLFVVIPALNASASLKRLLPALYQIIRPEHVIVVDDGSVDDTNAVALAAGANVIRHAVNMGKGAALRSGFENVRRREAVEVVVTMDADGQHDPADLLTLIDVWKRTNAGIVVGWRKQLGSNMPFERRLSNALTSFLVRWRTQQDIRDSQCGYRLIAREVLDAIVTDSNGFEAETEFLLRASAKGVRITSASVRTIYSGERSFMTHWATTKAFLKTLMRTY